MVYDPQGACFAGRLYLVSFFLCFQYTNDMNNKYTLRTIVFTLVVLVFGAAGIGIVVMQKPQGGAIVPPPPITTTGTGIKQFANFDQLKDFVAATTASAGYGRGGIYTKELAAPTAAGPSVDFPSDFAGFSQGDTGLPINPSTPPSPDYSQTNSQVVGVDEADIVKSDGNYIYTTSGSAVHIIKANPATDAAIVSTIDLPSTPQNLFVNGDKLVVMGYDNHVFEGAAAKLMPIRYSGYYFVNEYDISDRAAPKQIHNLSIEGNYTDSRMIGNYVYLVSTKTSYDDPYPLPRLLNNGVLAPSDPASPGYRFPNVYFFPQPYSSTSMTTVTALDITNPAGEPAMQSYVLDNSQNIYVSSDNLYITSTQYVNEDELLLEVFKENLTSRLSATEQAHIVAIEAAPDYILSHYERLAKALSIFQSAIARLPDSDQESVQKQLQDALNTKYAERAKELEKTVIHKVSIKDGILTYVGSGSVPGYVLNQYAMDESDGNFRIATTRSSQWQRFGSGEAAPSYSNVYVLDQSLKQVGALENLEPGERIYAVRFMQDRAYLVTFKQVDPLFVIDLKDPTKPAILGQLKVPGYSEYLHPYDDTTLIGLGRDTFEDSPGHIANKGIKVTLFDVADVASPKEISTFAFGDSSTDSEALRDPKAFLFSKAKNLLVIPVSTWGRVLPLTETKVSPIYDGNNFRSGAYVFTITKEGAKLQGVIDHTADSGKNNFDSWRYTVRRSLYVNDWLYTLSQGQVKANALSDLAEIKKIELPYKQEVYQPIGILKEGSGGGTASSGIIGAPTPAIGPAY